MIDKNYLVLSDVPINANVSESKIDPYIPKAIRELRDLLDVTLFESISVLSATELKQWSKTDTYTTGQRVIFKEYDIAKVWQAVQGNSNQQPTTANTANWLEIELGTFLEGYVKPWLAHHVYVGYAVNGGVNVTHQGLQEISNETANPVSGNKLDAYLSYWQGEKRILKGEIMNYLDERSNELDGVSYIAILERKKERTFTIRAIDKNDAY
jgi:hypothetical protein